MSSIYYYKLTHDSGAAPCVQDGILSLAICKPMIRVHANGGDLIFGFAAKSLHRNNRLIYIARVTDTCSNYFRARKYIGRVDCIYQWRGGRYVRRNGARFHERPEDILHDLGSPPEYPRAHVLLSQDFRYFGRNGTAEYKHQFPRIKRAVETLGRGHRVRFDDKLRSEFLQLKRTVWEEWARKVLGRPTEGTLPGASYRSGSCGVLEAV